MVGAPERGDARNLVDFLSRGWRSGVAGLQHHDNQVLPGQIT
jgi:hypothetical protein